MRCVFLLLGPDWSTEMVRLLLRPKVGNMRSSMAVFVPCDQKLAKIEFITARIIALLDFISAVQFLKNSLIINNISRAVTLYR